MTGPVEQFGLNEAEFRALLYRLVGAIVFEDTDGVSDALVALGKDADPLQLDRRLFLAAVSFAVACAEEPPPGIAASQLGRELVGYANDSDNEAAEVAWTAATFVERVAAVRELARWALSDLGDSKVT